MTKQLTPQQKIDKVFGNFDLFSRNFLHITDNSNNKIKFTLNEAQEDIAKMLKKDRFIILPKSRQAGISTMMCAYGLFRCLTLPNQNVAIISYKQQSAHSLFEKIKDMEADLEREKFPNLFPEIKRSNRNEILFLNGSRISSTTAGNKDILRGETVDMALCSELAFWADPERQLLSLEQAMAKSPDSRIVIESTANGINHFHTLCNASLKNKSKYKLYFIPFYHKLYRKQFSYEIQEAEEWYKATNKGKRLSKEDLDEDELALFEKGASLKQLMWRLWKRQDMSESEFFQEFPSNIYESFISTNRSVFDQQKVLQRMGNTLPPLSREDVLEGIQDFPQYLVKYIGKGLDIFHLPEPSVRYWGGSDVAAGGGNDSSTISILDSDGQEVLHFNSNKVPVYLFAEILNDLGRMFGYAFFCVERNSYGLPVIERLRKDYEYMNLYKQRIFNERGVKGTQLGFTTTQKTKAIMISDFKESFEKNLINIDSVTTLQQMQLFVETEGKTGNKRGNSDKHHDDSVISSALAVQAMKMNKYYVEL